MSQSEATIAPAARVALELELHPDDAKLFWRSAALLPLRGGARVRTARLTMAWHDGADRPLAQAGLALAECRLGSRARWRLECLRPGPSGAWPPSSPAPLLEEAADPAGLTRHLPDALRPIAHFEGVARSVPLDPAHGLDVVRLHLGTLRALEAETAACRVMLEGYPREAFALARALAGGLRLEVPRAALAAGVLIGHAPGQAPARHLGSPALPADATVSQAMATLIGQLADVLLYWAPLAEPDAGPEPVHQMRVALRRLRSALKLFRRAARCPELDCAESALRELGSVLAPARDWEVFITGLGRSVARAFPDQRAVLRLLQEAERERRAAYRALRVALASAAFRQLGLMLAELAAARPWEMACGDAADAARAALLGSDLRPYARHALSRRARRLNAAGPDAIDRSAPELHALRLQCKRLRYTAEFLAPLYSAKESRRFLRRLATVQERLGRLNDGAVAGALLGQLGGGAGRALAAGLVRGFVAASEVEARARATRSWRRLRRCEPFWE